MGNVWYRKNINLFKGAYIYTVYEMISDLYLSQLLSVPYRRCLSPFAAAIYCSLSLGHPS